MERIGVIHTRIQFPVRSQVEMSFVYFVMLFPRRLLHKSENWEFSVSLEPLMAWQYTYCFENDSKMIFEPAVHIFTDSPPACFIKNNMNTITHDLKSDIFSFDAATLYFNNYLVCVWY